MKKYALLFVFTLLLATMVFAQSPYKTAIGARLGSYTILNGTLKHFITNDGAIDFIFGLGFRGLGVGLGGGWTRFGGGILYQHHIDLPQTRVNKLRVFIGGGPFFSYTNYRLLVDEVALGGVIGGGVDYTLENAPLNISVDVFPGIRVISSLGLISYTGVSVRYVIK